MATERKPANWKLNAARIGVLIVIIAISVTIYLLRDQVELLRTLGYPGIFIINVLGSATIVLPAPGLALVFFVSASRTTANALVFSWFWVGVAAGAGATIGELSGYGAGFSGQALMERTPLYTRLHNFTERFGMITILVLAIQPFPIFDLAGVAAGSLKMPLLKFLTATLIGKLIKMWVVAYAGANGIEWIAQFMR
ncbi:MAG TPA: VTT domain-containing protein [Anaerolineales bacterium]|nr:VTT domain-containing protein [Anaerolineales bacterium]